MPDETAPGERSVGKPVSRPRVSAEELLRGWKEVVIVHGDEEYRLRLTRNGKLILTK